MDTQNGLHIGSVFIELPVYCMVKYEIIIPVQ